MEPGWNIAVFEVRQQFHHQMNSPSAESDLWLSAVQLVAFPFVAWEHSSTLSDYGHLSRVDLSDAVEDDSICTEASHDCNEPVYGREKREKINYHFIGKILCDLKCGNSWELIGGTLHDKGKVMQHKLPLSSSLSEIAI